jgi:L-alanine-DL-glutamate epimerase-like enolase superfamily enzyme
MDRRGFLCSLAAAAAPAAARITRVLLAPVDGRFHKFVAMNRYDPAPKGHTYANTLVRIQTAQGVEGVGVMGYRAPDAEFQQVLRKLIGSDPLGLYEMVDGRIRGRAAAFSDVLSTYRHLDGPLFDLIGKLTGKPAWQLIGPAARERVEVYDGTLYFSDVWFSDRGTQAVVEEAEEAAKKGYRGVKLKIGRGSKWMEKQEGLRRDIEVTLAVRKALGPGIRLMVDANDGFQNDVEGAWRFVSETAGAKLHWAEELFPEDVRRYTEFRERMVKAGISELIADGENFGDVRSFEAFLRPKRLVDVLQLDIRTGGFLDNVKAAQMAEAAGGVSVPHNWGSAVGGLMGLQISKAVGAIPAAEDDRSTCDAIVADGYEFRGGAYTLPDRPGLSIQVDAAVYTKKYKEHEVVIS